MATEWPFCDHIATTAQIQRNHMTTRQQQDKNKNMGLWGAAYLMHSIKNTCGFDYR